MDEVKNDKNEPSQCLTVSRACATLCRNATDLPKSAVFHRKALWPSVVFACKVITMLLPVDHIPWTYKECFNRGV